MENSLSIQLDDFDIDINNNDNNYNNNNLMEIAFEGNDSIKKDDLFDTSFINNSFNSISKSVYSNNSLLPSIKYDKEDNISPAKKSKKLKKSSVGIAPLNSSFDSYYDKSNSSSISLKKRKDKKSTSSRDKKKSKLDKFKKNIGKFFNIKTNYSANISKFINEFMISIRLKTSSSAIKEGNFAWPVIDMYRGLRVFLFKSPSNKVLLLFISVGILLACIGE
jgi:hypothetical protein